MKLCEIISKKDFYSFSTVTITIDTDLFPSNSGISTSFYQFNESRCDYEAIKEVKCLSITIERFNSLSICLAYNDFNLINSAILHKPIKIEKKSKDLKGILKNVFNFNDNKFSVIVAVTRDDEDVEVFNPPGVECTEYYDIAYEVDLNLLKDTINKAHKSIIRIFIQEYKEGIKEVEIFTSPASIIYFGELEKEEKK